MRQQKGMRGFPSRLLSWLVAALLGCLVGEAHAQQPQVDLQLVLAVDTSGSVNQARFELQRQGYAAAFRSPAVLQAIQTTATH